VGVRQVVAEEPDHREAGRARHAGADHRRPPEERAIPVRAGEVLDDPVDGRDETREHDEAREPGRVRDVAQPPEHDEVRDDDPRPRPAARLERPSARQRRDGERRVEDEEDAVERRPADDPPSGHGRDDREAREPDPPASMPVVESGIESAVRPRRTSATRRIPGGGAAAPSLTRPSAS
jgi:hypothetical protein